MARNVKQVFDDNPAASLSDTDLIYLGRSPYAAVDDSAILVTDIFASREDGGLFFGDAGILAQDETNLYWDKASTFLQVNSKLFIGIGIPLNSLDVSGGATIGSGYAGTETAANGRLLIQSGLSINTTLTDTRFQMVSTASSSLGIIRIMEDIVADSEMRIGINFIESFRPNGSNGNLILRTHLASGAWGASGGNIQLWPNEINEVTFFRAGNVSIGSTSSVAKLYVISTNANQGLRVSDGTTASNIVVQALSSGFSGFQAVNFNGYFNGSVGVRFNTGKNRWRFNCDQTGAKDQFYLDSWNGTTGQVVFRSGTDGFTLFGTTGADVPAVNRIDVSGAMAIGATYAGTNTAPTNGLLVQGNVGISTAGTSVTSKLHIIQTATSSGVPVVTLDQMDETLQFMSLIGTEAAGTTNSISTDTTGYTVAKGIKIEVNGGVGPQILWLLAYTK